MNLGTLSISFLLKPEWLFLFPCSWKKEPKRAAAAGKIAKNPPGSLKSKNSSPAAAGSSNSFDFLTLPRRIFLTHFPEGGLTLRWRFVTVYCSEYRMDLGT
jgi:hypothetical protein